MNTPKKIPSREYLNECFTYDPLTGDLFWKERPRHHYSSNKGWTGFNVRFAGKKAGCELWHKVGGKNYRSHISVGIGKLTNIPAQTIIYRIMGIEVPAGMEIDHRNRNPFDNSWVNLRLGTKAQNCSNRIYTKKSTLPKGVSQYKDRVMRGCEKTFTATLMHNGKSEYLGLFSTPEEAHAAYCSKAKELHGEFARFN